MGNGPLSQEEISLLGQFPHPPSPNQDKQSERRGMELNEALISAGCCTNNCRNVKLWDRLPELNGLEWISLPSTCDTATSRRALKEWEGRRGSISIISQ
ncbi:hypothetical protein FQN60_012351, partial [Etheostoma spectabile]